jgi:hypothetical protein
MENKPQVSSAKDLTRFLTYVDKRPASCWLWIGGKDIKGYGIFWYKGKTQFAHRVSLLLHDKVKEFNSAKHVLHSCRNTGCVNPEHLREGTREENSADKVKDGTSLRGERCHFSKLNWQKVAEIRKSNESTEKLATLYSVSKSTIRSIINNKSWILQEDTSAEEESPNLSTWTI